MDFKKYIDREERLLGYSLLRRNASDGRRNETKQSTAIKTPRVSGVFFVCAIIKPMSHTFKTILATLSLIIFIPISFVLFSAQSAFPETCYRIGCFMDKLLAYVGLFVLITYFLYLKQRRDLFFWLTVIPFFLLLSAMAIGLLLK
ncbi:hypothetical protein A2818_00585 [Candidatus Nomurabacteria bacterium RIFCSPHIGHO2_01_FULL_40_12]|uniref:Uncharacterized protein n=1 Tax=Candidatus Nomurabacteria bacterium RIFCSPHIGHO2_01_FULL_40_12 TaxID=1801737 RepID=A0A1F6V118_9BACT|nr:MAG: hypothetical protein A2818_00585 [Candidatus Nomurabacteria bacterium RIFCSPHIGHO2_01_FULL_40_12]